jgi:hypothetical protein
VIIEITWNGSVTSMWVNGESQGNTSYGPPSIAVGVANIGQRGGNIEFFNGQLAAVSVFDRVLTDSERTTIGKAFAKELGVTYG